MTDTTTTPDTIEAGITVDAPPREVWAVVSDLRRMGEWSPQCRRMVVLGDVRKGVRTVNLNRHGRLIWPTSSKVVRYEPQRAIAFRISENGTVWSYELESAGDGTRVTERREAPRGTGRVSQFLIAKVLGGDADFSKHLERGMHATLARIKAEVEHA